MISVSEYRTVIFHHIPKTAGTTLYRIVDSSFNGKIHTIDGNQLTHEKSVEEFKQLPMSVKNEIHLLKGHRLYGLDDFFQHPCAYITIIREPAARFISSYYQMKKVRPELQERIDFVKSEISLEEYILKGDIYYGKNSLIKSFLNIQDAHLEITDELLDRAVEIAKNNYLLVGLTERFDESLVFLNEIPKFNIRSYRKYNVAKNYSPSLIESRLVDLYQKENPYDVVFYKKIEEIFLDKINRRGDFSHRLERFRKLNERINRRQEKMDKFKKIVKVIFFKKD